MKEEEKSICWLGVIPECDKDKVRYPTDEEIEIALYEAEIKYFGEFRRQD